MTFSFASMFRLMVILGVGSTILAVGVSRLDPPQPMRRSLQPITQVNINDFFLQVPDRQPRWLNSESGEVSVTPIVADDILEVASYSPWSDQTGHRQVVGRWSNRTLEGPKTVTHAFGLARYSFPEGRVLNQVTTDIFPVCPPCWFPGTRARVLFAAGDGQLYRFGFESDEPGLTTADKLESLDSKPQVVNWKCPKPGSDNVHICEISWPDDPRMEGRLLASMRICVADSESTRSFSQAQLWWLKLNHSGTEIVDAGPLVNHDVSGSELIDLDERSPTVAGLPDGSLALAYNRELNTESGWATRLAPLRMDGDHRPIATLESETRIVTTQSLPAPLAFSPDGRWLNTLVGDLETSGKVVRVPTIREPSDQVASMHPTR